MPRILALEQREGALWAKLELNPQMQQPVHLLTDDELARAKAIAVREFFDKICELADQKL